MSVRFLLFGLCAFRVDCVGVCCFVFLCCFVRLCGALLNFVCGVLLGVFCLSCGR